MPHVPALHAGLAAVGALAGVAAVVLIFIPLPAPNANGYSELWIEPLQRERPSVRIGIGSREQEGASYTVELRVGGVDRPFAIEQTYLRPGEETTALVSTPAWLQRDRVKVSATLFKTGDTAPYLRVAAWTPAAAP